MIELLRLTGFRSFSEFIEETNPYERELIVQSVDQWHTEQDGGGGGGGGTGGATPPGL